MRYEKVKNVLKKAVCILLMALMFTSMTACNVTVTTNNNRGQSSVDYNASYMSEKFTMDYDTCLIIAQKLDEQGFGKIKSYRSTIVNGDGNISFSDGKQKYKINVEGGYMTNITDSEGNVVMTIEDIANAAAANTTNEEPQQTTNDQSDPQTEPTEPQDQPSTSNDATTSSYLTSETQSILDSLDTDYNKVKWAVQYSPTGMEGIVISISPYMDGDYTYLLVAITNLYDSDVTFSAKGYAKGENGEQVGTVSFYDTAIRPGNTIARSIYCEAMPTGEIHWDNIELPNVYDESAYCEIEWTLKTDSDGYIITDYTIESKDYMTPGYVTALILDEDGYILAVADDYNSDKGTTASGTIQFFKDELPGTPTDLAIFVNALKAD